MTVRELIEKLQALDQGLPVLGVLDTGLYCHAFKAEVMTVAPHDSVVRDADEEENTQYIEAGPGAVGARRAVVIE